jgi:hypothetical protein
MECCVHFFHGGVVDKYREFEDMEERIEMLDEPPTWEELVRCARRHFASGMEEVTLRGGYDCGKTRAHYVLPKLQSQIDLNRYAALVDKSNAACWEIVVDTIPGCSANPASAVDTNASPSANPASAVDTNAGPSPNLASGVEEHLAAEGGTQELTVLQIILGGRENQTGIGLARDNLPDDEFESDDVDDDDISLGSEDGDEDEVQETEYGHQPEPERVDDDEHEPVYGHPPEPQRDDSPPGVSTQTPAVNIEGPASFADYMSFTPRQMSLLKQCHVEVPDVSNDKDLSMIQNGAQ